MVRAGIAFLISLLMLPFMANTPAQKTAGATVSAPTVSQTDSTPDYNTARLCHMLNLNSAFGSEFSDADILQSAEIALLDFAKTDENGRLLIEKKLVLNFAENFYGKGLDFGSASGYLVIPPKGYTKYEHAIVSVDDCGDSLAVVSAMTSVSHDGNSSDALVKSVFVKSESGSFGYHLISSEIL